MAEERVTLRINGRTATIGAGPARSLLDALRDDLDLTGTKYGCGEGECGACTVLLDGTAVRSCQVPISEVGRREVTTIEGLGSADHLSDVQRAFAEIGAFQCGYCTPGMILAASALLERNRSPSRDEIVEALDGNLCRCGGYGRILRAVTRAAESRRGGPSE